MKKIKAKFNKVMIIDDNNIDIFITEQMIKKNNFAQNIMKFNCPFEAIKNLSFTESQYSLPEIILLDLNLNGCTGFDFLELYDSLPKNSKNYMNIYMVSSTVDPIEITTIKQNIYVKGFSEKHITEQFLDNVYESFSIKNQNVFITYNFSNLEPLKQTK